MTQTNNLKINLVAQSQAQKEVTINEAIAKLEALLNRGVEDKDLSTPPVSPAEGDAYIVGAVATGEWDGMENHIAYYNQGWHFIEPNEGLNVWVNDEDKPYVYNGTNWVSYLGELQNISMLGVNSTADSTNKLAVASDAVLFTAGSSGDIQLKFNKSADTDTATLLYQTGYSGRAEIGLAGNDDLSFKVSPDGAVWNSALVANKTTANVDMPSGFSAGTGAAVKKILSVTGALDFPSISAASSSDLTLTVTGATTNSTVALGLTTVPTAGIIYMGFVSATNTVTIRAFNITASAINPAVQTFRATVMVF